MFSKSSLVSFVVLLLLFISVLSIQTTAALNANIEQASSHQRLARRSASAGAVAITSASSLPSSNEEDSRQSTARAAGSQVTSNSSPVFSSVIVSSQTEDQPSASIVSSASHNDNDNNNDKILQSDHVDQNIESDRVKSQNRPPKKKYRPTVAYVSTSNDDYHDGVDDGYYATAHRDLAFNMMARPMMAFENMMSTMMGQFDPNRFQDSADRLPSRFGGNRFSHSESGYPSQSSVSVSTFGSGDNSYSEGVSMVSRNGRVSGVRQETRNGRTKTTRFGDNLDDADYQE